MIVTKVFVKDIPEVTLTKNDQVVETLSPDRPDDAFAEWVLPRGTWSRALLLDFHARDATYEVVSVDPIIVSN